MRSESFTFPEQPDVVPIEGTDTIYEARCDYIYVTRSGVRITIPRGTKSDLLSCPRLIWTTLDLPPDSVYRAAAYIHDYLYANGGEILGRFGTWKYTRLDADKILLEAMERLGIPWLKRKECYYAVRLFGGGHWNNQPKGK